MTRFAVVLISSLTWLAGGGARRRRRSPLPRNGERDNPGIAEATPRLDAQIRERARPGLKYSYQVFDGATHATVVPGALMMGLVAVFDPPPPQPPL